MLLSISDTNTNLRAISKLRVFPALVFAGLFMLASMPLMAADHGTIVREAVIYLSPDANSHKLVEVERGREIILLGQKPELAPG